ncbi:methyltransferase domain-containing protein, partial [Sinorhizobium sp. 8-89]|uniref:protein-L-isoaspartate O-methyltransferase family protein n=1 Tax=Sinorhizobium sp. 7-81 TaxID=3049087 RepID=UPI0024C42319
HFRLVSEMWDGPTRSRDDDGALPLIYSNQPLMYVGNKGESFQASSSEPAFIMHLLAALDVQPGHRVLEIGCGTGWLLAMMAELSQEPRNVTGIEIIPELVKRAQVNLEKLGLGEVAVKLGDGNVLPTDIGSFDRVMYTASSFTFPTYLFDICQIGGKVVIPLRNRGLAEEVQILERTEQGFQAVAARLCKFVQMTQRFGNDPSGITLSDEALRNNYEHADREPLDIPGGPPGTLAFSSFMSKTRPDFLVIGLNDPKIPSGFNAGGFRRSAGYWSGRSLPMTGPRERFGTEAFSGVLVEGTIGTNSSKAFLNGSRAVSL